MYRADDGGENYLLTDYLLHLDSTDFTAAQTAFESGSPGEPSATWPVPSGGQPGSIPARTRLGGRRPIGENGSDNAANYVRGTVQPRVITYVETPFAKEHGLPVASVANSSGQYVQPTSANVSTALESATVDPDWSQNLGGVYTSTQSTAYPLSSYSYLVTPCSPALASAQGSSCDGPTTTSPLDPSKGAALGQFVNFLACGGQEKMATLGYAPLPPALVQADFGAIGRMNGAVQPPAPTAATCPNPYVDGELTLPGG